MKTFPDAPTAEKELVEGRVQGYLTSVPEARVLVSRHADVVGMPLTDPLVRSVAGFAVQRGNQSLLNLHIDRTTGSITIGNSYGDLSGECDVQDVSRCRF